jgi:hypothetical protein
MATDRSGRSTCLTVAPPKRSRAFESWPKNRSPAFCPGRLGGSVTSLMGSLVKKRRKRMRKKKHKKMLRRTRHQRRK